MATLINYTIITLLSLALPLYIYKHGFFRILAACIAEAACITFIYSSTFILCSEKSACGADWASKAIPLLIMAMNIGMIWPILAGYAKQTKKDADYEKKN